MLLVHIWQFPILQITEASRRLQWVLVCDSIATGRGGTPPPPLYHRKAVTWVQWVKQAPESHWIRKKEPNRTELHIKSTSSTGEAATACTWKRGWNLAFCRLTDFPKRPCLKILADYVRWGRLQDCNLMTESSLRRESHNIIKYPFLQHFSPGNNSGIIFSFSEKKKTKSAFKALPCQI